MVLQRDTKLGLTFGQIMSLLVMLGGMVTAYVNLNLKIAAIETRVAQTEVVVKVLEEGRKVNAINIETVRTENRFDHQMLNEKLDDVLILLKK